MQGAGHGSSSIIVAVTDTGILNHEDLKGRPELPVLALADAPAPAPFLGVPIPSFPNSMCGWIPGPLLNPTGAKVHKQKRLGSIHCPALPLPALTPHPARLRHDL